MKKFLTILLAAALVFSFMSTAYAASPITKDQYYARSTLSGNELEFYDALYKAIQDNHGVYGSDYGISDKRADQITGYLYGDSPELFMWGPDYTIKEIDQLNARLKQKSHEILNLVNDTMPDYEKINTLYFYLGKNIIYDRSVNINTKKGVVSDSHTIVGGLLKNSGVCDGFSASLQYLLYQEGILSYVVSGTVDSGPHAWNIIKMDNEWYYVDLTKDADRIKSDQYTFVLWDDRFLKSHIVDVNKNPPLPAATSTKYMTIQTAALSPTPQPTVLAVQPSVAPVVIGQPPVDPVIWYVVAAAAVLGVMVFFAIRILNKKRA